jgi:hypothetical protein
MENKAVSGISEDTLLKLINPEEAFKRSNFMEWERNEKSKRNHDKWVLGYVVFTALGFAIIFLYAGQINLLNKEAMTGLLGGVFGSTVTIFIRFKDKNGDRH